jgi:hypothetical protein
MTASMGQGRRSRKRSSPSRSARPHTYSTAAGAGTRHAGRSRSTQCLGESTEAVAEPIRLANEGEPADVRARSRAMRRTAWRHSSASRTSVWSPGNPRKTVSVGHCQGGHPHRARRHQGKIVGLDESPLSHDDRALHGVLELPDVSGPAVGRDGPDRVRGEAQPPSETGRHGAARRRWQGGLRPRPARAEAALRSRRPRSDSTRLRGSAPLTTTFVAASTFSISLRVVSSLSAVIVSGRRPRSR